MLAIARCVHTVTEQPRSSLMPATMYLSRLQVKMADLWKETN